MQAVADVVEAAEKAFGNISQMVSDTAREARMLTQEYRPHLENATNAAFSAVVASRFRGVPVAQLETFLFKTFGKVFAANEAATLAQDMVAEHENWFTREAVRQVTGNAVVLAASVEELRNPRTRPAFFKTYGLTWLATQPFKIMTSVAFDSLIDVLDDVSKATRRNLR